MDVPALGRRLNEMRNNFELPKEMSFPNILSEGGQEFADSEDEKINGPKAFGMFTHLLITILTNFEQRIIWNGVR